jgi:class 3 adenylate cyclase/tetratricopeptide (TPR) repeat protein
MYCDVVGSTQMLVRLKEPEIFRELVDTLGEAVEDIVRHHGGQIVRKDGDGFVILFGHVTSHDDAGRRATEAALDIQQAAATFGATGGLPDVRLRLRTVIHSGLVLLLPGDIVRGRFEIPGIPTNVTAHLRALAEPDEILVSESTLGADRLFFRTGPRRLVIPSGCPAPLAVYSVLGREAVESRFAARIRRGSAPFAGRQLELAALEAGLGRCAEGHKVIAAVVGPAGIGKTRLAGEFLGRAAARGIASHRGYCEAYLGARPLQPFAQLISSLLAGAPPRALENARVLAGYLGGMTARDVQPLLRLLVADGGGGEAPPPRPEAVAPALLALLARAGGGAPLILCIDDWQWTDDASRKLLELVAAGSRAPMLVLLLTRDLDGRLAELPGLTVVQVPPLSLEDSRKAAEALLTGGDPFRVERIARDAGGSPLFIEELCQARPGSAQPTADADRSGWLDMMIQARFSRLAPEPARLVQIAAVIGHVVPEWLFEAITGLGPEDPALGRLAVEDFVYAGDVEGTLRFKHGITRDAIYNMVGLHQRRALHGRVVEALLARGAAGEDVQPEMLAYHCGACGDAERALHYAMSAANKAMEASALDRAQSLYRAAFDAIATLEDLPDRAGRASDLVRRYGQACVVDPSPDQIEVLEAMAALARSMGNEQGLALAQYWLGAIHYGLGNAGRSIEHLQGALEAAATLGNPKLTAQIKASLGQSHSAAADYPAARILLDEAIAALRLCRTGRLSTGLAYSLCCRGFLIADQGYFDEAAAYYREVESILGDAEPPMLGSYMTQMAAISLWKGEWDRAIDYGERGVRLSERTRTRYIAVMSRSLAAYARWRRDGDPAAVDELVRTAAWFMSGASQQRTSLNYGWLAEMLVARGDAKGARFYAACAFRRARAADRLGEGTACRAMARIAALRPGRRDSGHYLALAYRSAEARQSPRERAETLLCAAEIAEARREYGKGAELAAEAQAGFERLGMTAHAAQAEALRSALTSSC